MTVYEACESLRTFMLNGSAEAIVYGNHPHLKKRDVDTFLQRIGYPVIPLYELTVAQMSALGFQKWDVQARMPRRGGRTIPSSSIYLIPLWMWFAIPPTLQVIGIDGESCRGAEMDNDNRAGFLAYGLLPVEPQSSVVPLVPSEEEV